jgi:diguanylate cyclase (GGDEF)-like protein
MVKENKNFKIIDLACKYILRDSQDIGQDISDLLNELENVLNLDWLIVSTENAQKTFTSQNFEKMANFSQIFDNDPFIKSLHINKWGLAYYKINATTPEIPTDELISLLQLVLRSLDERLKNSIIINLTAETRKPQRPELALEKLCYGLKGYLNISHFMFFIKNENENLYELYYEHKPAHNISELSIPKNHFYSYDDLKDIIASYTNLNLLLIETKIRNDKKGFILVDKLAQWQSEEIEMLDLFAEQIAIVINQHKLNNDVLSIVERELLLNQITTLIRNSLDIDEIIDQAATALAQSLLGDACVIRLYEKSNIVKNTKISKWTTNQELDQQTLKIADVCFKVRSKQVDDQYSSFNYNQKLNKDAELERELSKFPNLSSLLGVELYDSLGSNPVGMICLLKYAKKSQWTDKEKDLLEGVGKHLEMALSHAALYQESQQTKRQMALLHQLSIDIKNSLQLDDVLSSIAHGIGEILKVSRCFVRRFSPDRRILKTQKEFVADGFSPCADLIFDFEKIWINSLFNNHDNLNAGMHTEVLYLNSFQDIFASREAKFHQIIDIMQIKSYLSIPLITQDQVLGTINIHQCNANRDFTEEEINFIAQVSADAVVAIKNAELFNTIDTMSKTDTDTGLYNKNYFNIVAQGQIVLAEAKQRHISMIMVDLDHLKTINDTLGHDAGDEAILITSEVLGNTVRQTPVDEIYTRMADIVGRFGGDEFIILLPNTDIEAAKSVADRIANNLSKARLSSWDQELTCSIGVASAKNDAYDLDFLKKRADQALYLSKEKGRNSVSTSLEL